MAVVFNKFVRFLTKRTDEQNSRVPSLKEDQTGKVRLTSQEQIPSVMLAFSVIENKPNEDIIIKLLRKIFEKNENIKTQYSAAGETLLFASCKKGYSKVVRFLVSDCGLNSSQVTPLGTALHSLLTAFSVGNLQYATFKDLTEYLINNGCDIDAVNHRKMSPFLCAVEMSITPAITLYVNLNCDINLSGVFKYHALHLACINYRPDHLQYLLSLDGICSDPVSEDGSYPILVAMKEWCERYQNNVCFEAIHLPVKMKQQMQVLAMVEQLLLGGANPYIPSERRPVNLASLLAQIRREETTRGRWCKNCQQTNARYKPAKCDNDYSPGLEHCCNDTYIGCPCKMTPLFTGPSHDLEIEEENKENAIASTVINNPIPSRSVTLYGNGALPLSSQMLATCLLYGQKFNDLKTSNVKAAFFSKMTKSSIDDPYFVWLIRTFSEKHQVEFDAPLSLKALCRSVVRVRLATNTHLQNIKQLPLPNTMLDYVAMKIL